MNMDTLYRDRIIEAFTDLMRHERAPDLDFSEIARRVSGALGRTVPSQTVGKWLRDGRQPREADVRLALASVLHVSVGWLFYGEAKAPPSRSVTMRPEIVAGRGSPSEPITEPAKDRKKKA